MTAFLPFASILAALLGLSQAQCYGRYSCAPVAPVKAPITVPVTIAVEKCPTYSVQPTTATICSDDLNSLLLLSALGNQKQPEPYQKNENSIDCYQIINKLINALVYTTTTCAAGGNGGYGGNGGNGSKDDSLIGVTLLGPGKNNVADVALGGNGLLGLGLGAGNSKGGLGGALDDLIG